jgi:micrococcal nuclease
VGVDDSGCHHDKKQGLYHCHRGALSGRSFSSKPEALSALEKLKLDSEESPKTEYRKVTWVIDGDTIILNGNERVRLIGVNTPGIKHPQRPAEYFGKEAAAFTKRMVEGKKVRLEYDWQREDKYGRTLAYVYLADGTFLNAEIIKQGYGFAYTRFSFKYLDEFREYEREARENNSGLWKK